MSQTSSEPSSQVPRPGAHIPALDGVRGVAILLVLMYHFAGNPETKHSGALFNFFGKGSFGVDLFFVLSGYLITGILFDAKGGERYFRNFYIRRALRIFPLYYGVLFVTFVALPLLSGGEWTPYKETATHQLWLWFYGTNICQTMQNDWTLTGFNHFWSLAVEEHFYLIWPFIIAFCSRRMAMTVSVLFILAAVALRLGLAFFGGYRIDQPPIYALTLSRMDAIALGSLLALAVRGPGGLVTVRPWVFTGAAASVVLLAVLFGWRPADDQLARCLDTLKYSGFAGFFAGLMIWAVTVNPASLVGRFWSSAILRFFGKYSYGLYVFHYLLMPVYYELFPLDVLEGWTGSARVARLLFMAAATGASVVVALLSWNLYEKHFLKLKDVLAGAPAKQSRTLAAEAVPAG